MDEAEPVPVSPPRRRRSWPARIAIGIGVLATAVAVFIAAFLLMLNTQAGRDFVAAQVSGFATQSGMSFHVRRIEGSVYGRMTLLGFEVRDPRGAFLTSPALTIDWRPFAYLHSKIDVRALTANEARLLRLPEFKPVPSDPNAPILPDIDLALGKLLVQRFAIDPPVTGKRHILRIDATAQIADRRAQISLNSDAIAAAGVAGGDRLNLIVDAVPDAGRLVLKGALEAPGGGIVDSYAGLGKPISLKIDGSGDWGRWNGTARGTLAGESFVDLAIAVRKGAVAIRGPLHPGLLLTGSARQMVEPQVDLSADAMLDRRAADLRIRLGAPAFQLNGAGRIDLAQNRFGQLTLTGLLLKPGVIAPGMAGKDVRAVAVLDGPIARPTIDYRISATSLAFGTTGLGGLQASGKATIMSDRILIPVEATAKAVTGLNAAVGGLLTNVRVTGNLAYASGKILSDNLRLRSDRIDATAIIIADPAKGTYTGGLKGRINDYQIDGLGRINLETDARLIPGTHGGFGMTGWIKANTRRLDNASVRDFLGGNALVTANLRFDDGLVTVRALNVAAPKFRMRDGTASYRLADGRVNATLGGQSNDYGPFTLVASGTAASPRVRLRAQRPGLGVGIADVDVALESVATGYRLRGTGQSDYGPFNADVVIVNRKGPLAITLTKVRFAGIDFFGNLQQTGAGPFAGDVTLQGSGLNGGVRLSAEGKYQRADADIRAAGASIPGKMPITIGNGYVRGTAILYASPSVSGQFAVADLRQGALLVSTLQGRGQYENRRGSIALLGNGRSTVPFGIGMQARIEPDRITANARGEMNRVAFRLASPAVLTRHDDDWMLAPTEIVVPQGTAQISGSYGKVIAGKAILRNLDLSIAQAFAPGLGIGGKISGTIDGHLPAGGAMPDVNARLDIAGFTRTSALVVSDPVNIALLGSLSPSSGEIRALIRQGPSVVGRAQVHVAPIPAGGGSWMTRLQSAPLSGGIRYNGPAEVLWTMTGVAQQEVTGPIALAADFSGQVDQPSLNGVLRANALRYENAVYGTVISNIAIDGRFTQSQLAIRTFTGRAGTGTISGRGFVGFSATSGFPIRASVTLDNARLAKSDALGATVSGSIDITNSKAEGALIKGDLHIPNARYEIVLQSAAEVPELTGVRRKNAPPVPPQPPGSSLPDTWKLDIRIRAPNELFVSGMGLEAEWSTDMRITGTAANPIVVGRLDVVRGTYSFSGRRFDLSNSSHVTFNGDMMNPELAISASTSVQGVSAIINIAGYAQRPLITFTSTPTLPQDEVVSRLLFGTSVTSLSPMQALQLAAALNSLRASGGGLNPLGKLRSATGLDRLRVLGADKNTGQGTSLAAGKYISNNIYVEVITDARGFTQTQLEISLSRALSLLSATGSFGGSSVNLRYSKDY